MLGRHLLFEMHGRLGPSRRLRRLMYDPKSTTYFSCKWWDQRTKKYNPNGVRAKLAVSEARRNRAYNKLTYWYYLSESGEVVEVMLLLEQMNKESRPSLSPMRAITTSEDELVGY